MRFVTLIDNEGRYIAVNPERVDAVRMLDRTVRIFAGEFYADVPGDLEGVCMTLLGEDGALE